ncbi:MAG: histidinol-phosphate aminotransferase family protein [Bacteroidales bacterium]|nr:histidinol-phosphate aminotransferase family protein [Bacteroidales bacterium]
MSFYINPYISSTPRVFPKQGRAGYHRYDANENPEGLPKEFVDSVLKELTPEYLAMYPEPERFIGKYANYIGVDKDSVYCTNGSDHGIRVLLEIFGEPGKEVVTVSPTFEIYWVCCSMLGLKHKPVQYNDDFSISIDAILDAITADTRVVVLLNPNSPIGNLYTEHEVQRVIKKAKQNGAVVILDEAYHYFYDKTFLHYAIENENVLLLRTFSKLMSIAGCRVGMVVGHKDLIHWVKNSRLAYEVNTVGLLFAERILEHPKMIEQLIEQEKEGKAYLINELRKRGYWFMDCHGNYVLIKPKHDAHEIARRLSDEKKTLVHTYGNILLKDVLRVTIGSKKAMEFFSKVYFDVDKE